MRPIIQPRPPQPLLRDLEPQRLHEPELRPNRHAAPGHVASVRRDLRLMEDDVQDRLVLQASLSLWENAG